MVSRYDNAGRAMPQYVCGPFAIAVFEMGTYEDA
jgi:hypothetical protein